MKTISDFWKQRPGRLIFLIVYTAMATFLALLYPYLLKDIIDGIKNQTSINQLRNAILLLAGIGILRTAFGITLPYIRGRTNEIFNLKERNNIFKSVLKQGHSFLNRFPAGDVLERIDSDLSELSWFVCSGIFRPIEGIMIIGFAIFFLVKINWQLTLIAVLPMSVTIIAYIKLSPYMYRYFMKWRELISEVHNILQSTFSGIRIIKAYNMEERNRGEFAKLLSERINAAKKALKVEILMHSLFASFEEIGVVLILIFGGLFVIKQTLTIGEFIAFNAYVLLLLRPMIDIGNFFVIKKRSEVQIKRVEEIKNFQPDVEDEGTIEALDNRDIETNDVHFAYGKNEPDVLSGMNQEIPQGKKIGIAGTVGSGKSTLLKLIMRIVETTKGEITIGNNAIKQIPLRNYRSLYAYVPQEPALFSDTLNNNITFGKDYSEEEIKQAIKLAQLEEFIKGCPDGLNEMIGERGLKLSGGEKQRVAIARAVLAKPKILILDDATSNLDAETERRLIEKVSKIGGMTVVIVSHRLSVLTLCDYVYVFDQGKTVEQGTPDKLMKKYGLFWRLYQHQLIEHA